ncbi:MAG: type IV secretion system protein [Rhodospirillales bacterium]|nr:type IV secretion system protein [Rhodospirillales bacterium]
MASQGSTTGHDNAIGWFILAVLAIIIVWLIWYVFEYEIKSGVRYLRWSEMWVASWFVGPDYEIAYGGNRYNFQDLVDKVPDIPYRKLDDRTMGVINTAAMVPMRYVYAAILGILAIWALFRGPETYFRRVLGLDGLIETQAKNFPVIAPFIKFNPSKQPVRPPGSPVPAELPLFSEALGPEEWLAYNQIPIPDGKIDEEATEETFAQQLGEPWRGAQNLPDYRKVLLAAFCLKAARKRHESDQMLSDLAQCWDAKNGLRLSSALIAEARRVLRDKELSHAALSQANKHAYQTTAMMRALYVARNEGGVLAPAQFVWLRGYDRALWYPLNNLGRNTYHMEALGAMAHYKQERVIDRPIPKPKVEFAVKTIVSYMSGLSARPIPQLDYSKSSRSKGVKAPKSAGIKKPKIAGKPRTT